MSRRKLEKIGIFLPRKIYVWSKGEGFMLWNIKYAQIVLDIAINDREDAMIGLRNLFS